MIFNNSFSSQGLSFPPGQKDQILGYTEDNVVGPILKKSDLLSDETAALFGLENTAVPDDVFAILSKAALLVDGNLELPDGVSVPQLKIESGTYVGTGASTASLTFSYKPKILIISGNAYESFRASICVPYGSSGIFDGSALFINFSWNDNTVSWTYGNNDAGFGLNKSGATYTYAGVLFGG